MIYLLSVFAGKTANYKDYYKDYEIYIKNLLKKIINCNFFPFERDH